MWQNAVVRKVKVLKVRQLVNQLVRVRKKVAKRLRRKKARVPKVLDTDKEKVESYAPRVKKVV